MPASSALADERRLREQALRLNARYVEEVVIGWNLCPWAARAWRNGEVARRVFLDRDPDAKALASFADELARTPDIGVALAIFPAAAAGVESWQRFGEQVRREIDCFLVAAFHPGYRRQTGADEPETAASLVSLIRCTPDPTLQLVRTAVLDALPSDSSDRVMRQNFATVTARSPRALAAVLDDIRGDRQASYAALAGER